MTTLVVSPLLLYAMGFRGDALFAAAFLAVLPTYALQVFITVRLFPPDLEVTGEFRGILYGVVARQDEIDSSHIGDVEDDNEPVVSDTTGDGSRRAMFASALEPRTLEGSVIRAAALILVLSLVWSAIRPLIYRVFPEFGATQRVHRCSRSSSTSGRRH